MQTHARIKSTKDAQAFLERPYGGRMIQMTVPIPERAREIAHFGYGRFTPLNEREDELLLTNTNEPGRHYLVTNSNVVEIDRKQAAKRVYGARKFLNDFYGLGYC